MTGIPVSEMNTLEEWHFLMGSLNFYPVIEDMAECSGMCKPGLFFFGRSIETNLPPSETCFHHFKVILDKPAAALGGLAIFVSTLVIILFSV